MKSEKNFSKGERIPTELLTEFSVGILSPFENVCTLIHVRWIFPTGISVENTIGTRRIPSDNFLRRADSRRSIWRRILRRKANFPSKKLIFSIVISVADVGGDFRVSRSKTKYFHCCFSGRVDVGGEVTLDWRSISLSI